MIKNQTQLFLAWLLELLADWPYFCLASLLTDLAIGLIVNLALKAVVSMA